MKCFSPFPKCSRRLLLQLAALGLLLPLSACLQFTTQQGNVLKPEKLANIHVEDSRFHVESQLGTPVLRDDLHPNRAIYMDDYKNPDTGETYQRRVEVVYSEAGRVQSIKRFGFEGGESENDKANSEK